MHQKRLIARSPRRFFSRLPQIGENQIGRFYFRRFNVVAFALAFIITSACNVHAQIQQSEKINKSQARTGPNIVQIHTKAGITCNVDGILGPSSYSVRDLGQIGIPKMNTQDIQVLRQIRRYFDPPTLRFAYVGDRFTVFNAKFGPCWSGAPGYFVLNGKCNEVYAVVDRFESTSSVTDCWNAPRPWITNDRGSGHGREWF